jgi:hypothetical protein
MPIRQCNRREHLGRSGERAVGVVGLRRGRAEHGQQAVAQELVDRAAMADDHGHDEGEELVQVVDRLARARAFGERREPADVDERDRDHGPLGLDPRPHRTGSEGRSQSDT